MEKLDDTDKGILRLLQQNARMTNKEIADKLNKSITPIHIRIKRLQEEGFIQKYTAVLNPKKIQKGLTVFAQIQLKDHKSSALKTFMEASAKLKEVQECYHMTGAFDFLFKIAVSSMDEYSDVMLQKLSELPGLGSIQSVFVLSEVKNDLSYEL